MPTSRSATTPPEAELRAALAAALDLLAAVPDGTVRVPAVGTDVSGVVAHVAGCLSWYAHDLVAGPAGADAHTVDPRPDADLGERLTGLRAWGEVLARTVALSPPGEVGAHSDGPPDATGFAALGCAELLLHTDDVADALGLPWAPPESAVGLVLDRLFPDVAGDEDPWSLLRWATGRADLPGRDVRTSWSYRV
ncbi:hypothetical protein [Modestobacter sp. Leaf380]|uniref:hypothetical protein n=1 Tax=Modestobacter sp. Leaf380 TaxID=1736356 RepID=UPI0006F6127B|nr:hypothetical protein [Modestobacter sp. Leaf380]KQS66150.1 hypothetical protein ASG41_12440 [Modestobacter sp. Leaf380]